MPFTEAHEDQLAALRAKARQDKVHPMLINIKDGRLLPNVPKLRAHPNYRPYTGSLKATADERMRYIKTMGSGAGLGRQVIDSGAPAADAPFDLAKANKDQIMAFAAEEFQVALDAGMKIGDMRQQVKALAEAREIAASTPDEDDMS